jgi:Yip1 domain
MATFVHRVFGAMVLDAATFEEVEADHAATPQALVVVLVSSLAAGLGAGGLYGLRPATMVLISAIALASWVAWAMLTLQIGTRVLPGPQTEADMGQLLRTIGFAAAPGWFQVFAIISQVSTLVFVATALWMLAAMVVAVRQALDYGSTARAIGVCFIGWALVVVVALGLGVLFPPVVS